MKNLKRVLSMGLASVMLLGMMVMGASAANTTDFSDADKIQNTEAVTTMAALNVIKGKDDGSFDPTGLVTRGEMAKMITIIMNGGEEPVLAVNASNPMFKDIGGHWAQKYIEYCATNGIISGRGDGSFDPNANVTGTEAAKMALVALNYNADVFKLANDKDWMLNVNSIANNPDNKLYTNLSKVNPSAALTRDEAAQLLYNALDAKMMAVSYDITNNGTIGTTYRVSDVTLMEEKYDTIKAEGILIANDIADVSGDAKPSAADEDQATLKLTDDMTGKDGKKIADKNDPITLNVDVDLETLGHAVTVYVRENKKTKGTYDVVGGVVISSVNVEATNFTGKAADDISKAVKTTDDTKYFLNYKEVTDEATLKIVPGDTVTILSNDNDKKAEYVFVTRYTLEQVGTINTKNETMVLGTKRADFEDIIGDYEDLEKEDYVLVTPVEVTGSNPVETKYFVEKPTTFDGELNAYKNNDQKKIVALTIDKVAYDISWATVPSALNRADTMKTLNNEHTFYVDANGLVVAAAQGVEKAAQYAISWGGESGSIITTGRLKVTLADGTTDIYTISDDSDWILATTEDGRVDGDQFANADDSDDKKDAVGTLITYSFDDDGNIEVSFPSSVDVDPDEASNNGITFTQGKTLVTVGTVDTNINTEYVLKAAGRTSYQSNLNTPFFFVTMNNAGDRVSKVEVLTGYKEAKSVAGVKTGAQVVNKTGGKAEAVAYFGAQDPEGVNVDLNNHLYVESVDFTYSKYVTATVVMAGEEKYTQDVELARDLKLEADKLAEMGIDDPKNAENDDIKKVYAGHIWLYTINSNGRYELLDPATESEKAGENNEFWFSGEIGKTSTISVELGANTGDGEEFFITDGSVIINLDIDNNATPILGGGVEAGANIEVLVDPKTETVLMAKAGVAPCEEHVNLTKTEAKDATCTEAGNIEYWYCNDCGRYFSDEGETEITKDETVVEATGHDYDGQTWQGGDTGTHTLSCKNCDAGDLTHEATFVGDTGTCTQTTDGHACDVTHS